MADVYTRIIDDLVTFGSMRSPRGLVTFDRNDVIIVLNDPAQSLPLGINRKLSFRVAAIEALQLTAGMELPEMTLWASKNFRHYIEPTGRFWGAYGARIGDQLDHVIRKFRKDPDTRQAVITLWNPELDNIPGKLDYPCTIVLCFSIVDAILDLSVTMRGNDVWLGLPYDVFQFTQLQMTLARILGIEYGTYTHHAVSLHLYERDLKRSYELNRHAAIPETVLPLGLSCCADNNENHPKKIANRILQPDSIRPDDHSEAWYYDRLHPFFTRTTTNVE